MYIKARNIDDLLNRLFKKLIKSKNFIETSRGKTSELTGVLLQIVNPRARLSRTEMKGTLFSCLGELMWYLSKSNDLEYIKYYISDYKKYSDDGKKIYGGYGPRLFNMHGLYDQVENIICLLKDESLTRHAVIQLFDAVDIVEPHKDIPCTCTLQFLIRDSRLHMITFMRSNDVYIGLPHDIFVFTMLQEIIAMTLRIKLGIYKHVVGSLHLYHRDIEKAIKYVDEGWQSKVSMPAMPNSDPWSSIKIVLNVESQIRHGKDVDILALELDDYWKDIIRLLLIFRLSKIKGNDEMISGIYKQMSSMVFNPYILKRQEKNKTNSFIL